MAARRYRHTGSGGGRVGMSAVMDQQSPAEVRRHPLSVAYLAFVGGTGLSTLGDAAWMIALTATLTHLAGPAEVGGVLALAQIPQVVTMLGGGAMSDRRGPATVMIGADLLRFALMAIAALMIMLWQPTIALLVVLAAVLAVLGSFFVPASGAFRPQLLPQEDLVRGNALYLIGLRGGQAAGGPVGAWLFGMGGIAAVAIVDGISFLASAGAVFGCARPARQTAKPVERVAQPPLWQRIAEGLHYVGRSRDLTTLMVVVALAELASSGPVNVGLLLLANGMGVGAGGAGLLLTGFTIGATAAYLISLVWPVGKRAALVGIAGFALEAVVLAAVGWTDSLWSAVALFAGLGVLGSLTSLVLTSLIQRRTEAEVRGRVMSILSLLIYGAVPVGSVTIGAMIEWLGRGPTMFVQGCLALAAVLVFCSAPGLRTARLD